MAGDPLFKSRLGDFIRISKTREGEDQVVYAVPDFRRPPHWHSARPLPATGKAVGSLDSPSFVAKVEESISQYDVQLELFWRREELNREGGDRSVRTLGQLYRVEDRLRWRYCMLKPGSAKQNDRYIEYFARWADANGSPSMATISRDALSEYLQLHEKQPNYRVQAKNVIGMLMQTAVLVGWRSDNPVKDLRMPEPIPPDRTFWSKAEVERYMHIARDLGHPALGAMIGFMYETGQRLGDARVLEHGKHYSNGYFRIRQSKREAIINGKLKLSHANAIESQKVQGSNFLFTNPSTGTAYSASRVLDVFNQIRAISGQDETRWLVMQTLRHTFVVRQVAADTHPFDIAAMTGHTIKSIYKIMERYCIRDSEQAMRALKNLNRAEGGTDDDFGIYNLNEAEFIPQGAAPRCRFFGSGLERSRAVQFARRYLGREEVERMILEGA